MSGFLSSRGLLVATILLALPVALVQEWETLRGLWPHLPVLFTLELPTDKSSLAPLRLLSFFAVAILARWMLPARSRFLQNTVARSLACCGRHSLNVFCLGILLSVLGRVVLEQSSQSMLDQIAVTSVGVATLVAFAWTNDWLSTSFRRWRAPVVNRSELDVDRHFRARRGGGR